MNTAHATVYQQQVAYFKTGATRSYEFRKTQLKKLEALLRANEALLHEALYKDLHKHEQEVYMTELGPVYEEIKVQLKGMRHWMQPKTVGSPFFLFPSSTKLYAEPVGTVLIIGPWNYPLLLTLRGIAGAIAAGNTIILKPSEFSAHSAAALATLINENFEPQYFHVITGEGHEVLPPLLDAFHFDHIMFTGSTATGKKIMEMAAKNLSPVTLELGGKSPCIVAADAHLKTAAKRIVWGKLLNCGQSCVAPDYIIAHASIKDKLIDLLIEEIERAYGKDAKQTNMLSRIINKKRFDAIATYLNQGTIRYGGQTDADSLYIAPTILENVAADAPIMQEEIFGPVLPVFTYTKEEEVIAMIEKNPYPLALYVFTTSNTTSNYFVDKVRFGAGCINETIYQLGNAEIPFGGVGYSGHGGYLGKYSFDIFSHYKGVVKKANWFEPWFRHGPYTASKLKLWRISLGRKWF